MQADDPLSRFPDHKQASPAASMPDPFAILPALQEAAWAEAMDQANQRGLNRSDDHTAQDPDTGEVWQFMGRWPAVDKGTEAKELANRRYQFRHRNHPTTGKRVLLNVLHYKVEMRACTLKRDRAMTHDERAPQPAEALERSAYFEREVSKQRLRLADYAAQAREILERYQVCSATRALLEKIKAEQ